MKNNNPVTHFIEVYSNNSYVDSLPENVSRGMERTQTVTEPQEISYLAQYIESTASHNTLETVAVWHIRPKTKSNNN